MANAESLRKHLGLSQEKMAVLLGLPRSALSMARNRGKSLPYLQQEQVNQMYDLMIGVPRTFVINERDKELEAVVEEKKNNQRNRQLRVYQYQLSMLEDKLKIMLMTRAHLEYGLASMDILIENDAPGPKIRKILSTYRALLFVKYIAVNEKAQRELELEIEILRMRIAG